ncbi:hypothetical protein BDN70DRAFT_920260 [Pholiota conissans]|uniref:Uncharacterized protein n=1 Tax=Pholiota conissans TaxID=109636 RepID=A0A9P6CUP1_9AGAR|nr:hypothetical protein BDN70DRAFT_920260 [Pholiota conissans]
MHLPTFEYLRLTHVYNFSWNLSDCATLKHLFLENPVPGRGTAAKPIVPPPPVSSPSMIQLEEYSIGRDAVAITKKIFGFHGDAEQDFSTRYYQSHGCPGLSETLSAVLPSLRRLNLRLGPVNGEKGALDSLRNEFESIPPESAFIKKIICALDKVLDVS